MKSILPHLPLTDEKAKALVLGIRKRKGLKDQ
jgi:hypothetical protein